MSKIRSVSFIGSGNVATHLAKALNNAGVNVKSIYSRNFKNATSLARLVNAEPVNNLGKISLNSDLYIFSVNDTAVKDLAGSLSQVVGYNAFVAHTSGMVSSDIFEDYFNVFGVFYPLQTFKKNREVDIKEVPFLITANDYASENVLFELATKLSDDVNFVDDDKRKVLHVAAVFANNFTNFMYSLADDIVRDQGISFSLLRPLIKETAQKIVDGQIPSEVQTGPAVRKDTNTINSHLTYLKRDKLSRQIYQLLTDGIEQRHEPPSKSKKTD